MFIIPIQRTVSEGDGACVPIKKVTVLPTIERALVFYKAMREKNEEDAIRKYLGVRTWLFGKKATTMAEAKKIKDSESNACQLDFLSDTIRETFAIQFFNELQVVCNMSDGDMIYLTWNKTNKLDEYINEINDSN